MTNSSRALAFCVSAFPLVAASQSESVLQKLLLARSTAAYEAVQKGDLPALQALCTPNIMELGAGGLSDATGFPDMLKQCKTNSYALSDSTLRILTPTSAVLVYRVKQNATCNGKPEPASEINTDTFVKQDGKWLVSIHTEIVTP